MLLILELIGTVAFAISGTSIAIKKRMDLFGVVTLGMTTAVGGGIIRDLILGITPPVAFQKPVYALLAIAVSVIMFLPVVRIRFNENNELLLYMDAVGLAIFTVVGVQAGAPYDNPFLSVFVGLMTGVGGGVLRDLFAGISPAIFNRHFYASASLIGAVVMVSLYPLNETAALIAGALAVLVLRITGAKKKWSLPRA